MSRLAKHLTLTFFSPWAALAGLALDPLRRTWAHARLSAKIHTRIDPSVVILDVPEVHGTARISLGKSLYLYRELYLETHEDGERSIGDDVVISRGTHIVAFVKIAIGDGTMIGEYTSIRDANHRIGTGGPIRRSGHDALPIHVGRNVWIGRGVTILPGVTIDDGAVIGANAVVTHNVPKDTIVVGVPAKPPSREEDRVTFSTAPRILLSAYQCGPGLGSVSQIGWEWYARLARRAPTTVVTHIRNREALSKAGAPLPDSEVIFVDTEWFAGPLYRLASRMFPRSQHAVFLISSLDFFAYDWSAETLLRQRMASGESWNIIHAVTPVSPTAPTRLHRLGLPLIIGPLNGGLGNPPGFPEIMQEESAWLNPIRNIGHLIDAVVGSTRHATVILTATRATRESIPRRYRAQCISMLENGVDLDVFSPSPWPPAPSMTQPLKMLFVGRLLPFKGIPLLLAALARIHAEFPVQLTIVGEGPSETSWRQEVNTLGLHDQVTFRGPLSATEVAAHMRAAHIFCLPSVRESGGAVLLEAMAAARPVIAIAYGGPAEVVDDHVGRAIPPDGPEAVIEALAQTVRDVFADPEAWRRRGEEGSHRAEQRYAWDTKIEQVLRLYRHILGPDTGMELA